MRFDAKVEERASQRGEERARKVEKKRETHLSDIHWRFARLVRVWEQGKTRRITKNPIDPVACKPSEESSIREFRPFSVLSPSLSLSPPSSHSLYFFPSLSLTHSLVVSLPPSDPSLPLFPASLTADVHALVVSRLFHLSFLPRLFLERKLAYPRRCSRSVRVHRFVRRVCAPTSSFRPGFRSQASERVSECVNERVSE